MKYKFFDVIGLQRTGTNWLRLVVETNYDVERNNTFWKHMTPLGTVTRPTIEDKTNLKNFYLRDDTFYIATLKDYDVWMDSLTNRKSADAFRSHNSKNMHEIWNSWNTWKDSNLESDNFYYKNYLDWLQNWKEYFTEIEKITGWVRKTKDLTSVSVKGFDRNNYDKFLERNSNAV